MPLTITTVYTKERLLRFQRHIAASKWIMWILLGVCTLIVLGSTALLALLHAVTFEIIVCCAVCLLLDLLYLLAYVILPPFLVKKAKNLDTSLTYVFKEDCFEVDASNAFIQEHATVQYSMINRVRTVADEMYLFISRRQAYVVDLSTLTDVQKMMLRTMLTAVLGKKKVVW